MQVLVPVVYRMLTIERHLTKSCAIALVPKAMAQLFIAELFQLSILSPYSM